MVSGASERISVGLANRLDDRGGLDACLFVGRDRRLWLGQVVSDSQPTTNPRIHFGNHRRVGGMARGDAGIAMVSAQDHQRQLSDQVCGRHGRQPGYTCHAGVPVRLLSGWPVGLAVFRVP